MKLSPGFRFHPTDVELVLYYLKRKVMGKKLLFNAIAEVDIYKFAPWDLPRTFINCRRCLLFFDKSCMINGDLKWYFFCPAEKKYASGARLKRSTEFGYWKTTGRDRPVHYNNKVMGLIKTLIFDRGKEPKGDRTDWVMHEYRLEDYALADRGVIQNAYVLCIVFQKDGRGPQNGAQYGAPFKEEDWSDDDEEGNCAEAESCGGSSAPTLPQPINKGSFISTRSCASESICTGSSCVSCPSHRGQSSYEMPCISEDSFITTSSRGPEDNLSLNENDKDKLQELNCCSGVGYLEAAPNCGGNDIHGNLSASSNPNAQNACGYTNNYAVFEAYETW